MKHNCSGPQTLQPTNTLSKHHIITTLQPASTPAAAARQAAAARHPSASSTIDNNIESRSTCTQQRQWGQMRSK